MLALNERYNFSSSFHQAPGVSRLDVDDERHIEVRHGMFHAAFHDDLELVNVRIFDFVNEFVVNL